MLRIAAVGDLHFGVDSRDAFAPHLANVCDVADVLLLAGDLTRLGRPEEAEVAARELSGCGVPVVAVLGNHDYHSDAESQIATLLEDAGIHVLEGRSTTVEAAGVRIGVAGVKGFGGGFAGACGTEFGEPEMKAFVRHTARAADALGAALASVANADVRIALLHYAPVEGTIRGERPEIWPFLGSYLLGEAIDRAGADLVVHGHAHRGTEHGVTPAGIAVRNVAQPVLGSAFAVYCFDPSGEASECAPARAAAPTGSAVAVAANDSPDG